MKKLHLVALLLLCSESSSTINAKMCSFLHVLFSACAFFCMSLFWHATFLACSYIGMCFFRHGFFSEILSECSLFWMCSKCDQNRMILFLSYLDVWDQCASRRQPALSEASKRFYYMAHKKMIARSSSSSPQEPHSLAASLLASGLRLLNPKKPKKACKKPPASNS